MKDTSKQELAYNAIRERILSGRYTPGYRLVITQLAKELGASAIPIREAVRRLEAEGLVVFSENAGASVAPVDDSAYVETLQVLALLEGYATAAAAPHVGASEVARMREINGRLEALIEQHDFVSFTRLNREFHMIIYERCPNTYLLESIRRGMQRLDQVRHSVFGFIPARATSSVAEHEQIIAALVNGAPADEIEKMSRQHKLNTAVKFHTWAAHQPEDSYIPLLP